MTSFKELRPSARVGVLVPTSNPTVEPELHHLVGDDIALYAARFPYTPELDLAQLMIKRARIIGSTLRPRSLAEKAEVMGQLEARVWPRIEAGEIRPVIEREYPIEQVSDAHDLVASDKTFGKVVLVVNH